MRICVFICVTYGRLYSAWYVHEHMRVMIWAVNGPRAYPVGTPLTARPGANTRTADATAPRIHALYNRIN